MDHIEVMMALQTIVLHPGEHPDVQFGRLSQVKERFRHGDIAINPGDLVGALVNQSIPPYLQFYNTELILLERDGIDDAEAMLERLQKVGEKTYKTFNKDDNATRNEMSLFDVQIHGRHGC
mmetsp:Transcript_18486/g.42648  ORF Transcript_18486/g.42648 Transcript_18486/m.42648 type:complete len:121 (+) Transcript_18486:440-802(+)